MISLLASASALALQTVPTQDTSEPEVAVKADEADAIVITGHAIEGLDLLGGASVISGDVLQREIEVQIGDTLASLPGVSATSFTPGASRPVLRGFQGERIRVLSDGLGAVDVSNTSADHAVTIDPLTAESVEVLRGPAVLLFGSQAVGGAVNVIDRRIPRKEPSEGYHLDALGQYSTADDGVSLGGALDVALGSGFVAHGDVSWRKTKDLDIGSFLYAKPLRAELEALAVEADGEGEPEEAAEFRELAASKGKLPNSGTEQTSGAVGLSYLGSRFELGASFSVFDSQYGIPLRPGTEHHHEGDSEEGDGEENVSIDLHQEKYDVRGKLLLDGFLDSVTLRLATANYEHVELEGDEVGTRFLSDGREGRIEFKQRERNGWQGATGVQYFERDFDAIGDEAFVPANKSNQWGLFTVQEYGPGPLDIEAAARIEWSEVKSDPLDLQRNYTTTSFALGANYELAFDTTAGINVSRAERAPSAEELLSDGPHIATQSYELGSPDLKVETSLGGELFIRHKGKDLAASVSLWANWFDDFVYQADSGLEADGLPVFEYRQQDANYWGIELEASANLYTKGDFSLKGDLVGDYVRATLDDGSPVPRIPPVRIGAGLSGEWSNWNGRIEMEWTDRQDRIAEFETETSGHTLVNASIAWRPWGRDSETVILLQANNIFDVDARRHASFTKDFAPLAGRDFRISARFSI